MDKQPAEQVYRQIKLDIRDNRLPVGEPLKQQALSQKYGVSRIPIRDVLQRLKSEGWLVQTGKRGVMIPPLSAQEAEDLYLMRMHLEPLILSQAISQINQQVLGKATDILMAIDGPSPLSVQQHGELNWQFHACLYACAQRPTLFNTIHALHQQCSRYIGFHTHTLDYKQTSQSQHYALLEAIGKKRTGKAKSILKTHIADAGKQMVEYLLGQQKY